MYWLRHMNTAENKILKTLNCMPFFPIVLMVLEKRNLKYDSRVSYYREYVEQGTNLKTAISRGKKEWFLLNKTRYLKLLKIYKDEERAEHVAIERYLRKNGCDRQFKNHIGVRREFEMKIKLY